MRLQLRWLNKSLEPTSCWLLAALLQIKHNTYVAQTTYLNDQT